MSTRLKEANDIIRSIQAYADRLDDIDLQPSFHEALDIVVSEDDWMDYVSEFKPIHLVGAIASFDDREMEELASLLSNGPDLDKASILLDSLRYWRERGRI